MRLFLFFFFFVFIIVQSAKTQVTVVLSGGGSKSFMHIGVLQLLEEQNISIANIGGSSMGGFIAALYASGYDIESIKKIILSERSINASNGKFAKKNETLLYDLNDGLNPLSVEFRDFKNIGNLLPTSIISSVPLQFLLLNCFSPLHQNLNNNYDSLLIPLRITASEIQQKKLFLFKKKPLSTVVKASMSYPFYLSATEIDDSLIFMDGGLYNNFPIKEIAKEFNATAVVGSLTSLPIPKANSKNIVSQFLTLITRDNDYSLPPQTQGFIIPHNIDDVGTFDFEQPNIVIQKGIAHAQGFSDSLKTFHFLTRTQPIALARKKFLSHNTHSVWFDSLEISGCANNQKKYLRSLLQSKTRIWNLSLMEKRVTRFVKDKRFFEPDFSTQFNANDSVGILKIKTEPIKRFSLFTAANVLIGNSGGTFGVLGGLHYSFFVNKLLFDIEGNFIVGNYQNALESRLRIDIPSTVPTYLLFRAKLFQDNYFNWQSSFLRNDNPDYLLFKNGFSEISYTIPFTRKTNFQIGAYQYNASLKYYLDNKIRINGDSIDQTQLRGTNVFAELLYNNLNYAIFPTSGVRFLFKASYLSYLYETKYIHLNTFLDANQKMHKQNWVIESELEAYAKLIRTVRFGIDCRAVWSNIGVQSDYYSTLLMLPYFDPVRLMKNTIDPNYISDKFVSIGGKILLSPFPRYDKFALRLESYHLLKANEIAKNENNGVKLFQPVFEKQFLYKLAQYTILNASLVWMNKIVPISFSTNYFFADASRSFNFYLTVGYFFQDKRRRFY